MKNFFAAFIGTLSAFFILIIFGAVLLVFFIASLVSISRQVSVNLADYKDSYLVFDLGVNFRDTPPMFRSSSAWNHFVGREKELQVRSVVNALRHAADDTNIKGLFITGELLSQGYGIGVLSEIRKALLDFKASGKPIVAYMNFARNGEYYLGSVATDFVMDPYGTLFIPGLASEVTFFGAAFERFGIGVQVTRSGEYKSYAEPFVRRDFSPQNREQLQKLLEDIWGSMIQEIAGDCGYSPDYLRSISKARGVLNAEEALRLGLIKRVAYNDEIVEKLKRETGSMAEDTFRQLNMEYYIAMGGGGENIETGKAGERIAIIYIEGTIVDGESSNMGEVGGRNFAHAIRSFREDPGVKAIVVRVNSPGGSASASEHIQRELRLAARQKPVVVSMGSYAASGGYWVSAYGDRIFAEATTITGSIGVIGIQFDINRLANNWGITWDTVKTGDYADIFSIARAKTPAEMAIFQRMVDHTYEDFISKVSEGRKISPNDVRSLAGGRVWSGSEALRLGLIDEIGGLEDALNYARKESETTSGCIEEYPSARTFGEWVRIFMHPSTVRAYLDKRGILGKTLGKLDSGTELLEQFNDPAGIYLRLPADLSIR